MIYITKSEEETAKIAQEIAQEAKLGDIFALKGDLGSGKTTFTKFFGKSLGIKETITSPTFLIMKTYPFQRNGEDGTLVHIDAYRFDQDEDAESIGLTELIEDKTNIIVVEWPEKVWKYLDGKSQKIDFEYLDEITRKITKG
jgi:tRNA threonylcarbamoyladenosine biosynthesis protein TsaE